MLREEFQNSSWVRLGQSGLPFRTVKVSDAPSWPRFERVGRSVQPPVLRGCRCGSLGRVLRQGDDEATPLPDLALDPDLALVGLDERFHQGETQAEPSHPSRRRVTNPVVLLKNARERFGRDADALI